MSTKPGSLIASLKKGQSKGRALADKTERELGSAPVPLEELRKAYDQAQERIEGSLLEREWARIHLAWVGAQDASELGRAAIASLARLRAVEARHFDPLRAKLKRGEYGPKALLEDVSTRSGIEADVFVDRLLDVYSVPELTKTPGPENAPFLNSSIHEIRPLFDLVTSEDTFFDIGCGLGKVLFLVRFMTGARSIGIDYDPPLIAAAEQTSQALGLDVELVAGDAREVDYSEGSFFYMFEPFRGAIMDAVLERIREAAAQRVVRIALRWVTNYPFTPAEWMEPAGAAGRLSLYVSRPTA